MRIVLLSLFPETTKVARCIFSVIWRTVVVVVPPQERIRRRREHPHTQVASSPVACTLGDTESIRTTRLCILGAVDCVNLSFESTAHIIAFEHFPSMRELAKNGPQNANKYTISLHLLEVREKQE